MWTVCQQTDHIKFQVLFDFLRCQQTLTNSYLLRKKYTQLRFDWSWPKRVLMVEHMFYDTAIENSIGSINSAIDG